MKLILSQSRLNAYERCQRQYYYKYILVFGGEKIFIKPLDFGILVHSIIEEALKYDLDCKIVMKNIVHQKIIEIDDDSQRDYESRLLKLIPILEKICGKYKILSLEEKINYRMFEENEIKDEAVLSSIVKSLDRYGYEGGLEGIFFGGIIDAVVIHDGQDMIIDWKTGTYNRQWSAGNERQTQLYTHLKRLNDIQVDKAMIFYVEQEYKHMVDVDAKKCKDVYKTVKSKFKEILEKKDIIENFEMVNEPITCNGCFYDYICHR